VAVDEVVPGPPSSAGLIVDGTPRASRSRRIVVVGASLGQKPIQVPTLRIRLTTGLAQPAAGEGAHDQEGGGGAWGRTK
jgi:hypothetical protein